MNVGCNKGHDSIAWLQRFDQRRFWNLRTGFPRLDPKNATRSSKLPIGKLTKLWTITILVGRSIISEQFSISHVKLPESITFSWEKRDGWMKFDEVWWYPCSYTLPLGNCFMFVGRHWLGDDPREAELIPLVKLKGRIPMATLLRLWVEPAELFFVSGIIPRLRT